MSLWLLRVSSGPDEADEKTEHASAEHDDERVDAEAQEHRRRRDGDCEADPRVDARAPDALGGGDQKADHRRRDAAQERLHLPVRAEATKA